MNIRRCVPLTLVLATVLLLAGCSVVTLGEQSRGLAKSTILVGRIATASPWDEPVVVVACAERNGHLEPSHSRLLERPGEYEVIVPAGRYWLFAFGDANGNLAPDPGEPVGSYSSFGSLAASGGVLSSLDFTLSEGAAALPLLGAPLPAAPPGPRHSPQAGSLVDVDDELFSETNGKRGYWAPLDRFRQSGANVYFLEPYDPGRTPVLFVHGAAGSPRDWKYFIEHLDRSRFQAWLFDFPSGVDVDTVSYLLYWKLLNLHARYRFATMHIAAHSMGGLVARSFLGKYHRRFPYVRLFVSISTPWGGEELAKLAPAGIPVWDDMRPEGTFLASLFQRKLPPEIDYYLFFGYKGNRSLLRPENDGAVTLKSELSVAAQAEARRVYGFDESHVSILSSYDVVSAFNGLLSSYPSPGNSLAAAAK